MKSAKFHTCSPTTASMRAKPDGSCPCIRPGIPRSRASGYDRVQAGIAVSADRVADDVDSAGSSGVADTPTFFVNGRRQYRAYDIDTLTAAVKTAKAQPKHDVSYRTGQSTTSRHAAVLPACSPERAFRKPTSYRGRIPAGTCVTHGTLGGHPSWPERDGSVRWAQTK